MPTKHGRARMSGGYLRLTKKGWPIDSAGQKMTTKVPLVRPKQTIGDIQGFLFRFIKVFASVDYIYVVDEGGHLFGVLSIKDLYSKPATAVIGHVCKKTSLITVHGDTHQEKAVYLAIKHNIKAIPVVDAEHTLLGVIPKDTILAILYKETHEDLFRFAGVHPHAANQSMHQTPILLAFKHRIPWLMVGMLGGLLTANIIGFFEDTLAQNIILASFIPLIVYMSDAVGTQMEACVIRDIALDRISPFGRYFIRQLFTTMLLAISVSIAVGLLLSITGTLSSLCIVIALSLTAATVSAVFSGLLIPYGCSLLKFDPADVSGPVATILQDLLSVTIYFAIATWLL